MNFSELERRDTELMRRALNLAANTVALASPNPQVGCVISRDGQILGEGAHIYDNYDHAEIVALKQAASRGLSVRGATAYVTLEPCSHQGRTGPCADALIAAGLGRVVVATVDPNPLVSGRGLENTGRGYRSHRRRTPARGAQSQRGLRALHPDRATLRHPEGCSFRRWQARSAPCTTSP